MKIKNLVGPFVFKNKETGLYFHHENDVDDIDHAEKYKIHKYVHLFVGKKIFEYQEVSLHEEKLKISRIKKLQQL